MADPMRIRAQVAGDKATVRVLMAHEMESGQRKDAAGKTVPAWHISEVTATHNGKVVLTAEWGPAVSKNPLLQVFVKGAKVGDKFAVTWKDNKGDTRTDEATASKVLVEPPHISTQQSFRVRWQKSQAIDDRANACALAHAA